MALALAWSGQGEYTEAETLQREVLGVQKRALSDEHPSTRAHLERQVT